MKLLVALALTVCPAPFRAQDAGPSVLARVPFDTEGGLMFVDVEVAGDADEMERLRFLIDSGASGTVIEHQVADRLGLVMGAEHGRSPGSQRAEVTFRPIPRVEFRIGGHRFTSTSVIAAPIENVVRLLMGRAVHGILGHDFLVAHTLEVDHERHTLVLHDPRTYEYTGAGTALPITFRPDHANLPFTAVTIETETGDEVAVDMLVDSGGSLLATMGLSTPAIIDAVVPAGAPRLPVQGATGLANDAEGTMHRNFATRLRGARLGPFRLERPVTSLKLTGNEDLNLFGAALLRRFHVVFDYRRARLILEPNARFPEPVPVDRSGLFLVASEEDVSVRRVYFVSPGSPADEAGLRSDDLLLEIDGRAADAQSLHATRELFFERGTFALRVRRGDEVLDVSLATRDLL